MTTEKDEDAARLEVELNVVRARLKSEQAERLSLWPKAELSDTYYALMKRGRDSIRQFRGGLVGTKLIQVDLLLADIARVVQLAEVADDKECYRNQPCLACGEDTGTTQTPKGRFRRCNSCGYAG